MANNLRVFNLISDYNEAELVKPSVSFVVENDKVYYDDVPSPAFQGKWKTTYQDGHVESAQCGSSSAITEGEINLENLVSVEIGDCVTYIGLMAFWGCSSLTSCTIGNSVTSIGQSAFASCTGLTSIEIPDSVTSIGSNAFYGCTSLANIDFSDSVTSIGDSSFQDCTSLANIVFPDSVTSIGDGSFQNCAFSNLIIPSGVTYIGGFAFNSCKSLNSVIVNATTPPTLGNYAFYNTNNCSIYVPSQSLTAYKTAEEWRYFASRIYPIP